MGQSKSKINFLSYEDATRRLSDGELKRLKDAFKRESEANSTLGSVKFIGDVLGGFVPRVIAEKLYNVLKGNASSLTFKDLLIGLVLLTQGTLDEKYKFLFSLYCNEAGTFIERETMADFLMKVESFVPPAVNDLFYVNDRVTYDEFRGFISDKPTLTIFSTWFLQESYKLHLTDDTQLPTFYQTLAGVTHLDEANITSLEKRYWSLLSRSTNKLDLAIFVKLVSPPVPQEVADGLFHAFDENCDGHIDLKEMACGISACCQGPLTERQKFCFKIFDRDDDGKLGREDLIFMLTVMARVREESSPPESKSSQPLHCEQIADEMLSTYDNDVDGMINREEYLMWTVTENSLGLPDKFLKLLYQICHVVLGLRPQFRANEKEVIMEWLQRERKLGLKPCSRVYLISSAWWRQWLNYVSYTPQSHSASCSSSDLTRIWPVNKTSDLPPSTEMTSTNGSTTSGHHAGVAQHKFYTTGAATAAGSATLPRLTVSSNSLSLNSRGGGTTAARPGTWATQTPRHSHSHHHQVNSGHSPTTPTGQPGLATAAGTTGFGPHSILPAIPPTPRPIDNSPLLEQWPSKFQHLPTLTDEGGLLKDDPNNPLTRDRDYEVLQEPLWLCLSGWYGGGPALPRHLLPSTKPVDLEPNLELYPIPVLILRHQRRPIVGLPSASGGVGVSSGMAGGGGGMNGGLASTSAAALVGGSGFGSMGGSFSRAMAAGVNTLFTLQGSGGTGSGTPTSVSAAALVPKRVLTARATFSRVHTVGQVYDFLSRQLKINRDEMRLWKFKDEANMVLLEDEGQKMGDLELSDLQQLLIEQRNVDLTWPEEIGQLAKNKALMSRRASVVCGVTGLSNLGNTCFFNSAIQCVSHTVPLTKYFVAGLHYYELNRSNPNGSKGHIAQRYGELIKDLWSGTASLIAPLKLKMTVERHANQFIGYMQQDAQELLSVLLDGLHEDLNRITGKTGYKELKDSDGRPDELVAREAWEAHTQRNRSIIVDLFHGQLKSQVRCKVCGHVSVRFDPFSVLSLPLPMESSLEQEVVVFHPDGRTPVKHNLLLNQEDNFGALKRVLAEQCGVQSSQLLLAVVDQGQIRKFPEDFDKMQRQTSLLCAYIFPESTSLPDDVDIDQTAGESESSLPPRQSSSHHQQQAGGLVGPGTAASGVTSFPSDPCLMTHVIAYQRKMICNNTYFLANTKFLPDIFGLPVVIPLAGFQVTNGEVYRAVWRHLARLVSCTPDSSPTTWYMGTSLTSSKLVQQAVQVSQTATEEHHASSNHAQDCDAVRTEYPFQLKMVSSQGTVCALCSWFKFCRGCLVPCDSRTFQGRGRCYLAVDWDPTALHLRYQSAKEKDFVPFQQPTTNSISGSVPTGAGAGGVAGGREPTDLTRCLEAFTREEELGDDQLYQCTKCRQLRPASKKLDLWKLPPYLIVHLKRFQLVNGRWQKSHKTVYFPKHLLDLTRFLEQGGALPGNNNNNNNGSTRRSRNGSGEKNGVPVISHTTTEDCKIATENNALDRVTRGESSVSSVVDPLTSNDDDAAEPSPQQLPSPLYNLYAVACHEGQLHMGHYVSYAKNPNGLWYLFNDSSCKEIPEPDLGSHSAYMLFYERVGVDAHHFMPDLRGLSPDYSADQDEVESDVKKMCTVQ